MTTLSPKQAYLAMYQFMATHILRDRHQGFLSMISSMSFLPDGGTADPAMWWDWEQAVTRINKDSVIELTSEDAHAAMCRFLETYNARSCPPDEEIAKTLARMSPPSPGTPRDPDIWRDWLIAVEVAKKDEVDASLGLPPRRR